MLTGRPPGDMTQPNIPAPHRSTDRLRLSEDGVPTRPMQWTLENHSTGRLIPSSRVCDRCITKKIKCNLQRPKCSACAEARANCTYSHTRRKPGPTRGSRRRTQQQRGLPSHTDLSIWNETDGLRMRSETDSSTSHQTISIGELSIFAHTLTSDGVTAFAGFPRANLCLTAPMVSPRGSNVVVPPWSQFNAGERLKLIDNYLATVNTAFPLFRPSTLLKHLENGTMRDPLPRIIYAISTKLMDGYMGPGGMDVDSAIGCSLVPRAVQVESISDPAALNQWQTACLLSWYDFHESPGKDETVSIAILIRKAYQGGLDQIDNENNRSAFGWQLLSEECLEDWRHVWWCLYLLDCYVSFSTGIPHQVEMQSLRTALLQQSPVNEVTQESLHRVYLPADQADLWKTTQDIVALNGSNGFGLHMAASSLLKEVLVTNRLYVQKPCQTFRDRMSALEDHLSAVELALPVNYMRCTQDLLGDESDANYHYRLVILLKFLSVRLLLRLPYHSLESIEWDARWQETLGICYRMIAILQHWNTWYLRAVDPAIGFIGLSLLVCLHLHGLSRGELDQALRKQLDRRKNIVRLFMRQYSTHWALPGLLTDCYDTFAHKVTKPLSAKDIDQILKQFQGPLLQRWVDCRPSGVQESPSLGFEFACPENSLNLPDLLFSEPNIPTEYFDIDTLVHPFGVD